MRKITVRAIVTGTTFILRLPRERSKLFSMERRSFLRSRAIVLTLYFLWYDGKVKRLWYYFIYLFLVWGSFRYFVRYLPEAVEELWFKPVIWLVPLCWWNLSLKERVIVFGQKWFLSVTLGLIIAATYFLLFRRFNLTNIQWTWDLAGVGIATAVTEELVFSGFVMGYMEKLKKSRWVSLVTVAVLVMTVRLPILLFVYRLGWKELSGALLLTGATGAINAWIRAETGSAVGSILARMGMNLAILG